MSGFPIEKAKEAMKMSLEGLYPNDTFNLITFAGDTAILFDKPVYATRANLDKAQEFLASRNGGGGTEMMKAIKAALEPSDAQNHLRIVCFMTDGYVGNENEIIAEVQKHQNARVFSFGIGSSVNRYLLDKIAEEGRGEAEYVALEDEGSKAAKKFYERVRTPLLTDISVDWNNLPVADVFPNKISDLFSAKPVILHGRYTKAASGTIRLKGKVNGQELVREIPVDLPETESANDVLATLWARTKIDDLMSKSLKYDENADETFADLKAKTKLEIIQTGLKFNLLTQFTSFVAVENKVVNYQGKPKKVEVPVKLPQGVSPNSNFIVSNDPHGFIMGVSAGRRNGRGIGQGSGNGSGNGGARAANQFANVTNLSLSASSPPPPPAKAVSGGVVNGKAINLTVPAYPVAARATGLINVQITIDESGNVISASAVSGHPLLRQAAEQAARKSTFAPTMLSGKAVKVTGIIVYNFANPQDAGNINISIGELHVDEKNIEQSTVTPEMQAELERVEKERLIETAKKEKEARYRQILAEKLHFWIYDLVARLQKGESISTTNEAKFVKDGKADVQIQLTAKSPETIEKVKNLGFEIVDVKNAKIIFGRIAVEKLANLAEIAEVQYVLPLVN